MVLMMDRTGVMVVQHSLFPNKTTSHLTRSSQHSLESNFEILVAEGVEDWVEGGVQVATPRV